MFKVLLVDDVPALRQHFIEVLDRLSEPLDITEAASGAEAVKLSAAATFDLIVMDIVMPEMNGIHAAQAIWSDKPNTKILFWSQFHKESFVRELGKILPDEAIHGYALKTESDEKLLEAVQSVLLQDVPYIDPIVRGIEEHVQKGDVALTGAEYETLLDVMLGLNDRGIALHQYISVRGVQNRISSVSQKLVKNHDNYLKEAAGVELYNTRMRIALEALRCGLIDISELERLDTNLDDWLLQRFKFDKKALP
ncbi:MAG TPA: response regulator transcription factor [Planktothrix sp.]|jgi:DNA-binding NarL/FixJ family response regulator